VEDLLGEGGAAELGSLRLRPPRGVKARRPARRVTLGERLHVRPQEIAREIRRAHGQAGGERGFENRLVHRPLPAFPVEAAGVRQPFGIAARGLRGA